MSNYPGKLIVLYGINNLGKTTQAKLLVESLKKAGYKAEYLKYPIYDLKPSGEMLNDYLRQGNFYNLSLKEAQILYALNRTQYQENLINKLKAGINVVAEDYKGTGIAWGLGGGISETFLKNINSHLIDEDLVFLFDGERFKESIENGHRHENNDDLMNKVRWAHLKLKEEYGWIKINANQKIEEIADIVWQRSESFLKGEVREHEVSRKTYNYSGFKTFGDILSSSRADMIGQLPAEKIYKNEEALQSPVLNKEINESPILNNEDVQVPALNKQDIQASTPKDEKEKTDFSENKIENKIDDKQEDITTLEKTSENIIKSERKEILKIEKISNKAKMPTKAHESDAGFDIYANDYHSIPPYGQALVETGIKMAIPLGYAVLIWDKSGLASQGITTMGGVIDSGYRGEIKVVVKNLSEDMFNIIPGQKIAQFIIQKLPDIEIKEGKIDDDSLRGENGFGSSGKF